MNQKHLLSILNAGLVSGEKVLHQMKLERLEKVRPIP